MNYWLWEELLARVDAIEREVKRLERQVRALRKRKEKKRRVRK